MTAKAATKGHTYACQSCGLRRRFVGALTTHVRNEHQRKLSAPEYELITDRQAAALWRHTNSIVMP